ncbi:MAG: sn-glycerol-3-phosphate ABC transporter ATP-binding protein UgpC [Rhizobiales bacterium]|nr:sn-glycerol-3-phosphate ABC transporter ATP-binding protein UgpC [Hyphomicrobiales bacterium]MBI3672459.1 sn-glycerol-3-phosphate ABC transporter ATP-binding protein UgpC [Hyphomicrobiales bacterium]
MASIELSRVSKLYANGIVGVRDVDLRIEDGEFIIFLGPSGCGKSTLLRTIAGLEGISSGEVRIAGQLVNNVAPRDRNIAVVFQSYALYPHMTVWQNMAFGIKMRGAAAAEIETKVQEAVELLGLTGLLDRKPGALSGGQRQRVALGRAIVRDPQAFLLDEPLSNLDAQLRAEMRLELVKLHRRLGRTTVHVTHDQVEAMTMGDRICIMREGRLIQAGAPLEVYANPADTFVAKFLASPPMNLIAGELVEAGGGALSVKACDEIFPVPDMHRAAYAGYAGKPVIFGVRSEDFYESPQEPHYHPVTVKVVAIEALGPENILIGQLGQTRPIEIAARLTRHFRAAIGSSVTLYVDARPMHLFDVETTKVIARPPLPVTRIAP